MPLLLPIPLLFFCVPLLVLGIILVKRRKDSLLLLALGIGIIALSSAGLAFAVVTFAALFAFL